MTELKACPFCGHNEQEVAEGEYDGFQHDFFVRCWNCGSQGATCGTTKYAIIEWNKREA